MSNKYEMMSLFEHRKQISIYFICKNKNHEEFSLFGSVLLIKNHTRLLSSITDVNDTTEQFLFSSTDE